MTSEESKISMAECGACRAVIPADSTSCPKCGISFLGVSDEALGACGACDGLAPLDSTACPHCGVSFIADDVVEVLSKWLSATGLAVSSLFSRFDANDDGEISSEELRDGLLALNLADLPPSQIEKLISILDEDGNGTIDLGELERIITGESSVEKVISEEEDAADDSGEDDSDDDDSDEGESEDSDEGESDDTDDDSGEDDSDDDSDDEDSDEEESDDTDDDSDDEDSDDDDSDDEDSEDEESDDTDDDSNDEDSDEEESDDTDDDSDDEDSEDKESDDSEEEEELSNLQVLGIAIAKSDMSIKEVFEAMDTNNDGRINGPELQKGIIEICGENLSPDEVYEMLKQFDEDDDGSLDPMELIEAIESLDMDIVSDKKATKKKVKPKKPFPTDLQKAMMGKKWNDIFWPLIHFALFAMAAIWIANGLIGFVDGTGGSIAYDGEGAFSEGGEWLEEGDIYACEPDVQNSECKNSLTPLAGDDGSSSMPVGFYWDGILMMLLFFAGMGGSIYAHLVLMKNWRAESKKLKDESGDSEDGDEGNASDSDDDEDDDSDDDEDDDSDGDEDDDSDDDEDGDSDDDEDDDSDDDEDDDSDDEDDSGNEGEIDIGSRIGVEVDGKEYFGEIIEFNDEEETVVIEDEDSGDEITAMQDDMFVE
jgi:Ca2+-binding EF-hand superfamily protein/RNA polymerase subunit RPABC4/transcription elongation factor Spt4